MSSAISTICPQCSKKVSVRAELEGKKIRCKKCGAVFPVKGESKKASAGSGAAAPGSPGSDTEADSNPYGITDHELGYRCPICANDMEDEDAIICLNCGFNTQTREPSRTRHIKPTTAEERIMWLLPGFLCIFAVFVMLVLYLRYPLALPYWMFGSKWDVGMEKFHSRNKLAGEDILGENSAASWCFHYGIEVWVIVIFAALSYHCIKFAVKRLILHPNPPEREK